MIASYLSLSEKEFQFKINLLTNRLNHCDLCPRHCKINRNKELGFCKSGRLAGVASATLHFGEEPPISGTKGSGAVFFHHCTLQCLYCQNYPISQMHDFPLQSKEELAQTFLNLQKQGSHNINLVTPTHFVPQILEALYIAREEGLKIPLVYNSSGYESSDVIEILDDIIDIYLLDMKYSDNNLANSLSHVKNYVEENQKTILAAFKQTGFLKTNKEGIGEKGLIIRHLVLPGYIENSKNILDYIANNLSSNITLSLMSQYFPAYKASTHQFLNRKITQEEYEIIVQYAIKLNFNNAFIQDL